MPNSFIFGKTIDKQVLEDPQSHIIDKGGEIWFQGVPSSLFGCALTISLLLVAKVDRLHLELLFKQQLHLPAKSVIFQ